MLSRRDFLTILGSVAGAFSALRNLPAVVTDATIEGEHAVAHELAEECEIQDGLEIRYGVQESWQDCLKVALVWYKDGRLYARKTYTFTCRAGRPAQIEAIMQEHVASFTAQVEQYIANGVPHPPALPY